MTPKKLSPPDSQLPGIDQLLDIIAKLRGPGGCPWDQEQTHTTLRAGLIEEAYEVAAAIDAILDEYVVRELLQVKVEVFEEATYWQVTRGRQLYDY